MKGTTVRHTVVFTLKHPPGSPRVNQFFEHAARLAHIPGVERFERLRQVSNKNGFQYGLSMEFEDDTAYRAYCDHPAHVDFVATRWIPEVAEFLEIDYVALG